MVRIGRPLDAKDRALIRAAEEALRRGFAAERYDVAAAVRMRSGAIYLGFDIIGLRTPSAEPVAFGTAVTAGDREIESTVVVCRLGRRIVVVSPCGTCRQMLFEYAPKASAVVRFANERVARLTASECLPVTIQSTGPRSFAVKIPFPRALIVDRIDRARPS